MGGWWRRRCFTGWVMGEEWGVRSDCGSSSPASPHSPSTTAFEQFLLHRAHDPRPHMGPRETEEVLASDIVGAEELGEAQ